MALSLSNPLSQSVKHESPLLGISPILPLSESLSTPDERVSSITQNIFPKLPTPIKLTIPKASTIRNDSYLDWEDLDQLAQSSMTLEFGYDIEKGRERQTAMTPRDPERYGQGLGQYSKKYQNPGMAFKLVPPLSETDLSLNEEEWEEPMRTSEEFYAFRDRISALYLSNIIITLRGEKPKKKEGKSL